MPIYEFRCKACGHKFEELCRLGEAGETLKCPCCGVGGAQRLVSGFSSPGVEGGGSSCGGCSSTNCGSCSCH